MRKLIVIILYILAMLIIAACGPLRQPEQPIERSSVGYGWMNQEQFAVTATGAAGAATGSQDSDGYVRGHIYAIHLDYAPTISITSDITLTTRTGPVITVLTQTNLMTDTWFYPVVQQTDVAGSGTSTYDRTPTNDRLTATVAGTTASRMVTITVLWGQ